MRGTFFTTLRPGVMMTLGNDGALVFQSEPISATKSRLTVSSLFPKSYFARDDFERLSQNYYRRNEIVVVEDKDDLAPPICRHPVALCPHRAPVR